MSVELLLPDVIAEDELPSSLVDSLLEAGVQIVSLSPEGMEYVSELSETYNQPSRADLFGLACAAENDCILVSGDKSLKSAAEMEGVDVHGTLWFLDKLVEGKCLSGREASDALERMIAGKPRLPQKEVTRRLSKWRSENQ